MKRLDLLKQELETVSKLKTLSFDLMESCKAWYRNEIEAIEKWGSANPEVKNDKRREV